MRMLHHIVLFHKLQYLHDYRIPVTHSLTIYSQTTFKPHQNYILSRIISDHQMTCCILPSNNISKKQQNNVIEVENVNEHILSNLKEKIIGKDIYNRPDHIMQTDPNKNYEIL